MKRRAWPGDGVLAFPCAPEAEPRVSPALWSPEAAPDVVVLETSDPTNAILRPPGSELVAEAATDAERHVVIAHGPARLRLCVRHAPCRPVPAFSIPRDAACALRIAAAARLQQVTRGGRVVIGHAAYPTAYQRLRFVQFLRLFDALEAGASTRDLAFGLVFPNHRPIASAIWKGSGERRHVLRLIAEARLLVGGGYRKLLRHN